MAQDELERMRHRCERERRAREEAETIAERATRQLYDTVEALRVANAALDQQVAQLSTPVLRVWAGVLAVPLIGAIDERRGRQLTSAVMQALHATRAPVLIIDLTGVPDVGAGVGETLQRLGEIARLLGARALVAGASAKVAQSAVELGSAWEGFRAFATLADALAETIAGSELGDSERQARAGRDSALP